MADDSWNVYEARFHCDNPSCCDPNDLQDKAPHHCVAYKDIEYRTCQRCGTKTEHKPKGKLLITIRIKKEDPTKEESDFKRNNPRKYQPRQGKTKRRKK
jgi:hypothetical protein